jgi:ABC-type hemin transport system ATPase subunit
VLANISLSFLPGAKIGVLGPNRAGKVDDHAAGDCSGLAC